MQYRLNIEKLVQGGFGLARLPSGKTVFIPLGAPGDEVLCRVVEEKSSYARAEIEELLIPGEGRRVPPCSYYGRCGGCQLMHLELRKQQECKRSVIQEIWRGRQPVVPQLPAELPELGYRSRVTFQILPDNAGLGFMHRNTNTIVNISDCLLCQPLIRKIMPWLREELLPQLSRSGLAARKITVVAGDQGPAAVALELRPPVARAALRLLAGWAPVPLDPLLPGWPVPVIEVRCGGFIFSFSTRAFFQANLPAAAAVFPLLPPYLSGGGEIVELYGGAGFFSAPLAASGLPVTVVEQDPDSRVLFMQNMRQNSIQNAVFHSLEAGAWFKRNTRSARSAILFLDPPRTGVSRQVRHAAGPAGFRRILYLSCDPATQARDLGDWRSANPDFQLSLFMFDFFPQTYHAECLGVLHERP